MAKKIYYIDDEADLLELFVDFFSSPEYEISTFNDCEAGIEAIRLNPPDLLVLDLRLPATTGDEIALKLDPNIPKVLVTGDLKVELKASFIRVFEKPLDPDEFQKFMEEHFSKKLSS